jgi:hypothetical protein
VESESSLPPSCPDPGVFGYSLGFWLCVPQWHADGNVLSGLVLSNVASRLIWLLKEFCCEKVFVAFTPSPFQARSSKSEDPILWDKDNVR